MEKHEGWRTKEEKSIGQYRLAKVHPVKCCSAALASLIFHRAGRTSERLYGFFARLHASIGPTGKERECLINEIFVIYSNQLVAQIPEIISFPQINVGSRGFLTYIPCYHFIPTGQIWNFESMRLKFHVRSTLKLVSRIDPEKRESYSGSHGVIFPTSWGDKYVKLH